MHVAIAAGGKASRLSAASPVREEVAGSAPASPRPISVRPSQKKNPSRLSSTDDEQEEESSEAVKLEGVRVKAEGVSPTPPSDEGAVVPKNGLKPAAPLDTSVGSGEVRSARVSGGKLVHRKGRLVSESSSEGGDEATDAATNTGGRSGLASTTAQNAKEELPVRTGSKGTENTFRPPQQQQKAGLTGDKVSRTPQVAPLASSNNKGPTSASIAGVAKLRLVDIDFTGGRAKSVVSKPPAQRKPAPSVPAKKPDPNASKPLPTSLKVSPRQPASSVLMVSGVVDKATYGNHDSSGSPSKATPIANGRKDLVGGSGGMPHAQKDAILSAKFPQLKRKMLSEQVEAEAPAAKMKKLLS